MRARHANMYAAVTGSRVRACGDLVRWRSYCCFAGHQWFLHITLTPTVAKCWTHCSRLQLTVVPVEDVRLRCLPTG